MKKYLITRQYECVQFKDLPEGLKEKIICEHYEPLLWDICWWDWVLERFKEDREEEGVIVETDKICFDLSYTHGQEVAWSGYLYDAFKFLETWKDQKTKKILTTVMERDGLEAIAKTGSGCYQDVLVKEHLYQEDIEEICEDLNVTEAEIESALDEFEAVWEHYCKEKAWELLSTLEKVYEDELREECINEFYEINNIVFDVKTGKSFLLDEGAQVIEDTEVKEG